MSKKPSKEEIINGDRFCTKCGEFLGAICDPFGRDKCAKGCHDKKESKS